MKPTKRQWAVLEILWDRQQATARQITDTLQAEYGWAYTTVKTMLDRMVAQDLVTMTRKGNLCVYAAACQPDALRRSAWRQFIDTVFGNAPAEALHFAAGELTPQQRAELRKRLDDLND